jgi:hypothetical protein
MLFREIIAVFCENHVKHIDTLLTKSSIFLLLKHMVHMVTTGLQRVKIILLGFLLGLLFDPADGGYIFL